MKERLDQLRAMDSAAFMTLPASSFSPMPKEAAVDLEEISSVTSPYTNLNGHIPHAEGERRRKEMLEVATKLEERYRVLLPPDRVRKAQESVLSESASGTQELSRASSKQPSVIRILKTGVPTPYSPPPSLSHAEASPLSPSPTIDMDIPPSPLPITYEPATPERLPTPPTPEWTTTSVPERLPTPPTPKRPTTPTLVDVADQDGLLEEKQSTLEPPAIEVEGGELENAETEDEMSVRAERPITPTLVDVADQDGLLEKQSTLEPPAVEGGELEKAVTEDEISVPAESEDPAPQNELEREEDDVESEDNKMNVEQDRPVEPAEPVEPVEPIGPIPTVADIEQVAIADLNINAIPEETLIERTILLDAPQVSDVSDSTVIVQAADVPVSEVGFNLDRAVTPEQRPQTDSELVDIEALMPISSISAPRGRGRKRPRLDPSIQNETVSAPVRGPRVPKNHVTFRGASGEMEVTASAILKAAVHRTQRDVTRHLNAFGVPVPNYIVQMGPPFELPEWVFPPLSPAESEHALGDFDVDIEDFELNPNTPSKRQLTPPPTEPSEADHISTSEVDRVEQAIDQATKQSQSGPKIVIPWRPPPRAPEPEIEEDTVSLGDEDA